MSFYQFWMLSDILRKNYLIIFCRNFFRHCTPSNKEVIGMFVVTSNKTVNKVHIYLYLDFLPTKRFSRVLFLLIASFVD